MLDTIRFEAQLALLKNNTEGRLAIIGCGRSGTTYTSKLLQSFGVKVGHEKICDHGISSWCLVPDTSLRHIGPSSGDLEGLGIPHVHQVRQPLEVISSATTIRKKSWGFISQFIPIQKETACF